MVDVLPRQRPKKDQDRKKGVGEGEATARDRDNITIVDENNLKIYRKLYSRWRRNDPKTRGPLEVPIAALVAHKKDERIKAQERRDKKKVGIKRNQQKTNTALADQPPHDVCYSV